MTPPCWRHPTLPPEAWEVAPLGDRAAQRANLAAATVCGSCPMQAACLADGLSQGAAAAGLIMGGRALAGNRNGGIRATDPHTCGWCKATFLYTGSGQVTYCGSRCRDLATGHDAGPAYQRGVCPVCEISFEPASPNQRYCRDLCTRVAKSRRDVKRWHANRDLAEVAA